MKWGLLTFFLFLPSLVFAYTYCDLDLKPSLEINSSSYNLTYYGNGVYSILINGTIYKFKLDCDQDMLLIQPSNLTLKFANETSKQFYLVLIPNVALSNLKISCLNCINFNLSAKTLNLNEPTTVYFNLTLLNASAGNHKLLLLFSHPLIHKTYEINVEIEPKPKLEIECPNVTEQYLNYPLFFKCKLNNFGNTFENLTVKYLDVSKNIELNPFSSQSILIFKELSKNEQLNLTNLVIQFKFDNQTIEKNVSLKWLDSSLPRIIDIDYPKDIQYGQTITFKVKAYDDTQIKSLKVYYLDKMFGLIKLDENNYEIPLKIEHLGPKNVSFEICDPTNCLNETVVVNAKKIKVFAEDIILPEIKYKKFYEIPIVKATSKVENYTVTKFVPNSTEVTLRPLAHWDTIYAGILAKEPVSNAEIRFNFSFPSYVEPQNVSFKIIFSAGEFEIEQNQTFWIKDMQIQCIIKDSLNPLNRTKVCSYTMSPYSKIEDWIALPVNYYHEMQSVQKQLTQLITENTLIKVVLAIVAVALAIFIFLWLKEKDYLWWLFE